MKKKKRRRKKTVPPLAWDQKLSRSLSCSDVSLSIVPFCLSVPSLLSSSLQWLSLYCFSRELAFSAQTCLLMQLIQMSISCFIYISYIIPEPSILNRTRSLPPLTLPWHCLFSFRLPLHLPPPPNLPCTLRSVIHAISLFISCYHCLFSPVHSTYLHACPPCLSESK